MTSRRSSVDRLSKGDRRERALLATAERLLADGCFEAASVGELAQEAGLSRASYYFYFPSKQALLSAVVFAATDDFESELGAQLGDAGTLSPGEAVARTVRAATDLWFRHRVVLLASVELGTTVPEVYDRTAASMQHVGDITVRLLLAAEHRTDAGADAGADAEAGPELRSTVRALILMTERNFYDLARTSSRREDFEALGDLLTTVWLRALAVGA